MGYLKVLLQNLLAGPATEPFPFGEALTPKGLRGRVQYDPHTCVGCRTCELSCAGGAIRIEMKPEALEFTLWHDTCAFCGLCAFYCPTDAIRLSDDWHLSHTDDRKFEMIEKGRIPAIHCAACGEECYATQPAADLFDHPPSREELERLRGYCPRCRRKLAAEGAQP